MLTINTNLSSLIAQSSMKTSTNKLNQAIERMTTGFKVNYAKDNAANYSISTNMTTKIGAYNVAEDNALQGLDMISTAEGTLDQIQDKLQRLRALAEQASNGTYGEQSLNAINSEANALVDEINRLYSTAEYNGQKLFGSAETSPVVATFAMARAVTVDESKRVSNVSSFTAGETYYITDSTDLVVLQDLVNAGAATSNVTFELMNDINMAGVDFRGIGISSATSFRGTFNGNGHVIKNLTIDTIEDYVGLFGYTYGATIDLVGVVNCNIEGGDNVGGLVGYSRATITSCYATGIVSGSMYVGGLVGDDYRGSITSCYATSVVSGSMYVGGLVGSYDRTTITNCYATGTVTSSSDLYGLSNSDDWDGTYFTYNTTTNGGGSGSGTGTGGTIDPTDPPAGGGGNIGGGNTAPAYAPDTILLQIGASSDWASQVGVSTKFSLTGVDDLRMIGLDTTTDYLSQIDDMLELVAEKQTHFGAVQNRLESVLEEITIQRDNLISSRSTIRDADIAEVSASYIQQQILQQASATLIATANQSPSIALQLI